MRKVITFLFLERLCIRISKTIFCQLKIIKLSAIDSTNSYLKELSKKEDLEDGLIVVAKAQTNGRGQLGSTWQSEVEKSLTFSMFKRFSKVSISQQSGITFAVSLALKTALDSQQIREIAIKWPNDIMSYQKKLAGILVENQVQGAQLTNSVIGVGLNVNEAKFSGLPQATSMFLSSGQTFNLDEVLAVVSEAMLKQLKRLEAGSFSLMKEEYEETLFRKNEIMVFEDVVGRRFNGIVRGVAETGELLLETEADGVQRFQHKEIKMLF